MEKRSCPFIAFVVMVSLFLIGFLTDVCAAPKVITVRADSWPPYNDHPTSAAPGSMVEIMKKIFEKEGYVIDYQVLPWNRSVKEVEDGKCDTIIGATTECPDCVTPKEPIGYMSNHFYVKKGNKWHYTGPDSLKDIKVGVIADYSYTKEFDAYVAKNKTDPKKVSVMFGDGSLDNNIKKLLAGNGVDAIVENPLVIQWVLTKDLKLKENVIEDAGELENSQMPLFAKFTGKKKSSVELAALFDKGIAELRKSGELKKILTKYNMKDWK